MKALLYAANPATQAVAAGGTIALGSIVRRCGNGRCGPIINLAGNGVSLSECGYYKAILNVTVEPTAAGAVTVQLLQDGVAIPGAVATNTAAAGSDAVSVCIPADVRVMNCTTFTLTAVLVAGAGNVTNVGISVSKE